MSTSSIPHNIPVEQALLGAILANNEAAHRVSGFLLPDHFYEPPHQRIYAAALQMIARGQAARPHTMGGLFEHDESMASVGGAMVYMAKLLAVVISVQDVENYGRLLLDLAQRRAIIERCREAMEAAGHPDGAQTAAELGTGLQARLGVILEGAGADRRSVTALVAGEAAAEYLQAIYRQEPGAGGLMTGLQDFDRKLGGLKRKNLVVLAARPSMGKTSLAAAIAHRVADRERQPEGQGRTVLFLSLEMAYEEVATRVMAEQGRIPVERLSGAGEVTHEIIASAVRSLEYLNDLPLIIDDSQGITMAGIRSRALGQRAKGPLALLVVDHGGLIRPPPELVRANRVDQIEHATAGLKGLAKELDCPLIALWQLNRGPEQRDDKRPNLADLRGSGSIEQDADVVAFIYREEYYLRRNQPLDDDGRKVWSMKLLKAEGIAEILFEKNRQGATGTVRMRASMETNTWADLQRQEEFI